MNTARNLFFIFTFSLLQLSCTKGFSSLKSTELASSSQSAGGVAPSGDVAVQAKIKIVDSQGALVPNAKVSGSWSGVYSGMAESTTDAGGWATFTSGKSKAAGSYIFKVTSVEKIGSNYDATKNKLTQATLTK